MSESSGNKGGKVRVMYVRNEDEANKQRPAAGRDRRNENDKSGRRDTRGRDDKGRDNNARDDRGRDNNGRDNNARDARGRDDKGRDGRGRDARDRNSRDKDERVKPRDPREMNPRYVREKPYRAIEDERNERARSSDRGSDSPWKTVSRAPDEATTPDHGGIVGKSRLDPEQIRRQRQEETRVYGENACLALFKNRPDAIVRAWFLQEVTPRFRDALRWMAANRKAYHVVDDEELTKASGTDHHGGVCFLIKKRQGSDVQDYLAQEREKDCVLALEEVGNPHNLGGIMRSCAHFGVSGVLIHDPSLLESGAAVRTAEGGAEHVNAIQTDDFPSALDAFRAAGYTIATTSSHKGTPLSQAELPNKMVLVLGHEGDGLTDSTWQQGDLPLSIGGTGNVESLNISVATGILLAEWWRQQQ